MDMSNKTSDKNVANIEDEIKILTEENSSCKKEQAIQHILAELEQKDKRIKELEEDLTDSIPKQVVIDKMEELNKEIKSCDAIDAIFKIKQQQVLQELLEGER